MSGRHDDEKINTLAKAIYEEMERLAPSPETNSDWGMIPGWERDLYRLGIKHLLEAHSATLLDALSDNSDMRMGIQKRE